MKLHHLAGDAREVHHGSPKYGKNRIKMVLKPYQNADS